jgi:hypothetical protein
MFGALKKVAGSDGGGLLPDIQGAVMGALEQNPTFQAAAKIPGMVESAKGKMEEVAQSITDLPEKAAEAVQEKLDEAKAAQAGESEEGTNEEGEGGNAEQEGGGPRYEIVELTVPINDPLYVYYMEGKPIYFTQNAYGQILVLPMAADLELITRYPPPHIRTKRVKHAKKRGSTKKNAVKSARKLTRKSGQRRSRRS